MLQHQYASVFGVAGGDGVGNRLVFREHAREAACLALHRDAMELHADGNVFLQRLHGGREVAVLGSAGDRKMELEVSVLAVRLPIGGVTQQFERPADRCKARLVVPERGGGRGGGFQCQPELIAVQEIGDVFQLTEASGSRSPVARTKLPAPRRE